MPTFFIEMGQGLSGDLGQLTITSGTFYTCSAIVFFNQGTGVGGLYHFPAASTDDDLVLGTLRDMLERIQPTRLLMMKALSHGFDNDGTSESDVRGLREFFATRGYELEVMAETGAGITASSNAGNLVVRNQAANDDVIRLSNQLAGVYAAPVPYRLYGVDLEHARRQPRRRRAVRAACHCIVM